MNHFKILNRVLLLISLVILPSIKTDQEFSPHEITLLEKNPETTFVYIPEEICNCMSAIHQITNKTREILNKIDSLIADKIHVLELDVAAACVDCALCLLAEHKDQLDQTECAHVIAILEEYKQNLENKDAVISTDTSDIKRGPKLAFNLRVIKHLQANTLKVCDAACIIGLLTTGNVHIRGNLIVDGVTNIANITNNIISGTACIEPGFDNSVARYDGTTCIQDSLVTLSDLISYPNLPGNIVAFQVTNANTGLAVAPNGTGALLATTAGNARGDNAVDLQMVQNAVTNVASGATATISGGVGNTASGDSSVVAGGNSNSAAALVSTISGGFNNAIATSATFGAIGGGDNNQIGAAGSDATIAGGSANIASAEFASIGGGNTNNASATGSTIGGGTNNIVTGTSATVPGGDLNVAQGQFSFAAGQQAQALHQGAFVWADSTNAIFTSTANDQFNIRAAGGTRIFSNAGLTAGVTMAPGASAFSGVSNRALKDNFKTVDTLDVLQKVTALPIETWNYKSQDTSIRHMGPMAQDFAIFGLGEDPLRISTLDADGVLFAAVQGLNKKIEDLKQEVLDLKQKLIST